MSRKSENNLRAKYLRLISEMLEAQDEQVLVVKSNELSIPTIDDEGNECFMNITFKVPKGDRSGEPYDAFTESQCYAEKLEADKIKAEKKAKEKAEKIARDEAYRKKKAEIKAKLAP